MTTPGRRVYILCCRKKKIFSFYEKQQKINFSKSYSASSNSKNPCNVSKCVNRRKSFVFYRKSNETFRTIGMEPIDACTLVENELSRVIDKFTAIQGHSNRVLNDVTASFEGIQSALNESKFLFIVCALEKTWWVVDLSWLFRNFFL